MGKIYYTVEVVEEIGSCKITFQRWDDIHLIPCSEEARFYTRDDLHNILKYIAQKSCSFEYSSPNKDEKVLALARKRYIAKNSRIDNLDRGQKDAVAVWASPFGRS